MELDLQGELTKHVVQSGFDRLNRMGLRSNGESLAVFKTLSLRLANIECVINHNIACMTLTCCHLGSLSQRAQAEPSHAREIQDYSDMHQTVWWTCTTPPVSYTCTT